METADRNGRQTGVNSRRKYMAQQNQKTVNHHEAPVLHTKFEYLYRDAGNWKQYLEVVVRGTLTENQVSDIFRACRDEGYFIPGDVGFPETRFEHVSLEEDHIWFELTGIEPTMEEVSDGRTAEDVFRLFVSTRWNEAAAMERLLEICDDDDDEASEDCSSAY